MLVLVQSQIVSLLDELLNQKARLRKGGNQAVYYCPCCHHYKRKLEVNLETGQWHCWTCNIKGSFLGSLLTKVKSPRSYRERLLKLTGDLRLAMRDRKKAPVGEVALPDEFIPLSQAKPTVEYKNALAYLKRRKILPEDIVRYNIGYCEAGPYEHHIIIPSYDAKGNLNFFMGRRYYETEGVIPHKKPDVPMNVVGFEAFINWNEPLNLCEGVFDAIAIRNNAIPLFGKYQSKWLREMMIHHKVKRVNIVLDSDAMNDAVKAYCRILRDINIEIYVVRLNGKDPSSLGFEKVSALIRNAKEFGFIDLIEHNVNL